jgi:hypothetical protein
MPIMDIMGKLTEHFFISTISKRYYIVEQYFGLSHLHDGGFRARFTTIAKNIWDAMCRQLAFNLLIIPVLT